MTPKTQQPAMFPPGSAHIVELENQCLTCHRQIERCSRTKAAISRQFSAGLANSGDISSNSEMISVRLCYVYYTVGMKQSSYLSMPLPTSFLHLLLQRRAENQVCTWDVGLWQW